jgi:hypothetical protein
LRQLHLGEAKEGEANRLFWPNHLEAKGGEASRSFSTGAFFVARPLVGGLLAALLAVALGL